jgi:hypothetical protein
MMGAFNVTLLTELGYDFSSTQIYGDPENNEFEPADFAAEAYDIDTKHSAVRSLGSLNAYQPASSLKAAQASYYAENANKQNPATTVVTQTSSATPLSFGDGFSAPTTSQALPGFEALETVNLLDELGISTLLRREAVPTTLGWQTLAKPTPSPATTAAPSRQ